MLKFLKRLDVEKTALYVGVALLFLLLLNQNACGSAGYSVEDCPGWDEIQIAYADSIESFASSTYSINEDNPIPTDTIVKERIVYIEKEKELGNWDDVVALRNSYLREKAEKNRVLDLLDITREQYDSLVNAKGGPMIVTVTEPSEKPAVIMTDKSEKTEEYEIEEKIMSHGPLINFHRKIKVYPKTITVTKKEVEYLRRNKFLSVNAGALYLDDFQNIFYTPSLAYGNNWWMLEAGPILDNENFSYRGFEAKAGLVFRFK